MTMQLPLLHFWQMSNSSVTLMPFQLKYTLQFERVDPGEKREGCSQRSVRPNQATRQLDGLPPWPKQQTGLVCFTDLQTSRVRLPTRQSCVPNVRWMCGIQRFQQPHAKLISRRNLQEGCSTCTACTEAGLEDYPGAYCGHICRYHPCWCIPLYGVDATVGIYLGGFWHRQALQILQHQYHMCNPRRATIKSASSI